MIRIFLKNDMLPLKIKLPESADKSILSELINNECESNKFFKIQDEKQKTYIINIDTIAYIYID